MSPESEPVEDRESTRDAVTALCERAFGPGAVTIAGLSDINQGRGAFSEVVRAELAWTSAGGGGDRPSSVVAKLPVPGPNGRAARAGGAYRREALAYREILPHSPVAHPRTHAVVEDDEGGCSLLLEDLSDRRPADQLDGLDPTDALRVAETLARFHRHWSSSESLAAMPVRRNTVAGLDPEALAAGLAAMDDRWEAELDDDGRRTFAELVRRRPGLVERFHAAPPTLCHGDPRADNLVFDDRGPQPSGDPILFDWQQMAIQLGEADLAWLAATSLTIPVRRAVEADLVSAGEGDLDRYRLGLALPGMAVLLLAQRELPSERVRRYVAVSLRRIAAALADNDTAGHGR